jgi:DNA-binding MltR family transcriptional regulator
VLVAASILDTELERALKATMRPLDKKITGRLFKGYGPLGSFSAKIDLAYALNITTLEVHTELHKIRDIRNAFAHTVKVLTMSSDEVLPLFNKLKRPTNPKSSSMLDVYLACVGELDFYLERYLIRRGITDDLSKRRVRGSKSFK